MNSPLQILLVEDSVDDAQLIMLQLEQDGSAVECRRVDTEAAFTAALDPPPDLILSDFSMPQFSGFRALQILRERGLEIPFILISGTIGEEIAVEAMKQGAADYLMKDRLARLASAVQNALNQKRLKDEKARADLALRHSEARFRSLIENSSDEVYIVSTEGLILYESPALQPTLGYPSGELVGKDLFHLVHPDDLAHVQSLFKRLVDRPTRHLRDLFRLLHQDGMWYWVEAVGTNLLHEPAIQGIVVNYHDVTERMQAEERIRYQALLLENVSDAVISTDMHGVIRSWNKAAELMFGYTAEQAIGQVAANVIKTEDVSTSRVDTMFKLQTAGSWKGEMRITREDGTIVDSIASASVIRDSQGQALGYISLYYDITARKQAEEKLQASESRYRLATRATNDVIWEWDAQTNQLAWSENVLFVFGYALEEIGADASWRDERIHPADRQRVISARQEAIQGNEWIWADEYRFLLKNGSYATISDQGYIERDSSGQAIRLIGAMSDITHRKKAEDRIRQQLQQLSALRVIDIAISSTFDMKTSLSVLLDKLTSQLKVSAAAILLFQQTTLMLEYTAGNGFIFDTIEQTRLKIGEGWAGRAALERHTIHIPNLTEFEERITPRRLLIDEGFISYYAMPLIAKGELKGVLEIFHRDQLHPDSQWLEFLEALAGQAAIAIDNSQLFESLQRSKTELEQRVAERTAELHRMNIELEGANRAKDEFLANMSHELRTPLNSIIGLSESLLEQGHDSLSEKQQKSLQTIASSGHHLLELITDILDLSKIEAGKFEFLPQLVPLDDLCRSSLAFVNSQAAKKSIAVTYENEASVARVSADPRRLKQILINLLSNAVKFTSENGQVTLYVRTNPEQDRIEFSVTDTGIGIAPQDLGRLFQPFVQLDSTLNRQYEGTGLGLSLVQKLADLHGGSVQVESEFGKGSRFTVYLPFVPERTTAGEGTQLDTELSANEQGERVSEPFERTPIRATVLIAEDNAANILTLGDYLEAHGYKIIVAHDGMEAVEKAEALNPEIILMDIQMPVMSGLEAMMRLRRQLRFTNTPIIALTALAMPGDRERCLQAGATEYMSKPVGLRNLANTIARLLEQAMQQHHEEQ